jgi:hypothetical protein
MTEKTRNTNDVRIIADVTKECRKSLRILAIQKETTLPLIVKDILERAMSKKVNNIQETNNE